MIDLGQGGRSSCRLWAERAERQLQADRSYKTVSSKTSGVNIHVVYIFQLCKVPILIIVKYQVRKICLKVSNFGAFKALI